MTVSGIAQTVYPLWKIAPKPAVTQVKEHIPWMSCPRCMGGMMYPESKREHVCIQCGHRAYHHKISNNKMTEGFHLGMK
jgi:uncharacterized protein (DUF983 family)